jgi:hypothetical protein
MKLECNISVSTSYMMTGIMNVRFVFFFTCFIFTSTDLLSVHITYYSLEP